MAKTFYGAEEAAAKLGMSEDELKGLVRQAKLREFRDAGKFNYIGTGYATGGGRVYTVQVFMKY